MSAHSQFFLHFPFGSFLQGVGEGLGLGKGVGLGVGDGIGVGVGLGVGEGVGTVRVANGAGSILATWRSVRSTPETPLLSVVHAINLPSRLIVARAESQ